MPKNEDSPINDIEIARALHVLSIVHWIGGVSMVTAVLLPGLRRAVEPAQRLALFEALEVRFSRQAKFSVPLAGLSGFYMTARLVAWDRYVAQGYWWMHAMLAVWIIFMFVLFVAEPLFLHDWLRHRAASDPEGALRIVQRGHWLLLTVSLVTIAGAVLGAHGALLP